jgi:hypothetical protein
MLQHILKPVYISTSKLRRQYFLTLLLSMFMLLSFFLKVCGLVEWKQICSCILLFVYTMYHIQLSKGDGCDPINRFNIFGSVPSQDLDFYNHMWWSFLYSMV